MAHSWSVLLVLQYAFLSCLASPAGRLKAVREAHPHITAAPVPSAALENDLLRRQDGCTFACAVCAMYAPCETCTLGLSTPAGIECCTSKLADQSACPTANVPPSATIFVYTLETLTIYGNPTSLVIDTNTLTPGGTPATVSGHTLSVPATATDGGIVEDGTTISLGTPISTVIGTGTGSATGTDASATGGSVTGGSVTVTDASSTDGSATVTDTSVAGGSVSGTDASSTGGSATDGSVTGGSATGTDASATGGSETGGSVTGGSATGTDASATGGSVTGGSVTGGSTTATDASTTGGSGSDTNTNTVLPPSSSLPASDTASNTGTGTGSDTITGTGTGPASTTGTGTGSGTITGSDSVSRTSYTASDVPTGIPWGVMLTTVSGKPYTLTWVGSQINTPTTIIQTGPSTTETTSQTAGGFIWTVPTLPPGFPDPVPPGPPPGFPEPKIGGGTDPIVPGCIFGCGGGGGGGGGGLPCLIDCGGGGGGGGDPTATNPTSPDPTNNPSNTGPTNSQTTNSQGTQSEPSSTQSESSCTQSSAYPSCTQVVSVSSFVTGSSSSVTTVTSTSCTTITGCSGTATTGASTATTASTATGDSCDARCGDSGCAAATAQPKSKRDKPLNMGRLATPNDYLQDDLAKRGLLSMRDDYVQDELSRRGLIETVNSVDYNGNMDQFISEEITKNGKKPLLNRQTGRFSSAIAVAFDSPPNEGEYYPSVSGLEGCTSIVIIGEKGCWISHFWEAPSFEADDQVFQDQVIHSIEQGDDGNPNMQSPFAGNTATRIPELADGEGDTPFGPEIFVSTPNADGGGYKYDARVSLIEQALVGPGRAFAGLTVKRRGYTIRRPPDSRSANGKVLIQYTNDQQNDMGERIVCPQTAIYRLWFETEKMSDHEWPAAGNQIAAGNNNRKRQAGACGSSISSGSSKGTATGTNTASTDTASTNTAGTITTTTSGSGSSSTAAPVTCQYNPVNQDPPNCVEPSSNSSSTAAPVTCQHNPVNQDPPNCVEPSSSSEPFRCSAGSNLGVATYDPATWCGCNTPTGTLYPTMTTGSGDAACAYTKVPDTTVKPTAIPGNTASVTSTASTSA